MRTAVIQAARCSPPSHPQCAAGVPRCEASLRASDTTHRSGVMGGDALDAFGQQITGRRMADVAQIVSDSSTLQIGIHGVPPYLETIVSYPSTENRIAALEQIAAQMGLARSGRRKPAGPWD